MRTGTADKRRTFAKRAVFIAAAAIYGVLPAQDAAAQSCAAEITWIRQFGTASLDQAWGAALDAVGNVYVVGYSGGTLPGQAHPGPFVRKYDPVGTEVWTRQFAFGSDWASDVAVDQVTGNIYVAGHIGTSSGHDAFLRKFDPLGSEMWALQIGAVGEAGGVAVDAAGDVYVAGFVAGALPGQTSAGSGDAYLRKYDSDGNVQWTRQFGSPGVDDAVGVAIDGSGNAYVAGNAGSALPGQPWAGGVDAFLRTYDSAGDELWTRQFGTSESERVHGVAVDKLGNVLVAGQTLGALPGQTSAGSSDAFVRKYDSSGAEVWTRQFGTSADCAGCNGFDIAEGVAADAAGGVYLVGSVVGPLPGETYSGGGDAFVRKYDGEGAIMWTRQFGSAFSEHATDAAIGETGKLYAAGYTFGTLPGQTAAGNWDAFVVEVTHDLVPPVLSVVLSPDTLWPPDHQLVPISASIQVSDNCDSSPIVTLVSVTSNEPDNGDDDGDTVDDIQIVGPTSFLLRAERSGAGTGRIYTVTYVATDASGNTSEPVSATVTVPMTIK